MVGSRSDEVIKAYAVQIPLYQKMLALSQEQGKCLQQGNYPILEEIAEQCLRLQDEISELSTQAHSLVSELSAELGLSEFNLSALRGKLPQTQISLLATAFERIASTITAIQAQDEANMMAIKGQMEGVRGQFGEMDRARQAVRAYNPVMPTTARFIDKKK